MKKTIILLIMTILLASVSYANVVEFFPLYNNNAKNISVDLQKKIYDKCEEHNVDYRYAMALIMLECNFNPKGVCINTEQINMQGSVDNIKKVIDSKAMARDKMILAGTIYKPYVEYAYMGKYGKQLTEIDWQNLMYEPTAFYLQNYGVELENGEWYVKANVITSMDIGFGTNSQSWGNKDLTNITNATNHFLADFLNVCDNTNSIEEALASYRAGYFRAKPFCRMDKQDCIEYYKNQGIGENWHNIINTYLSKYYSGFQHKGVWHKGYHQMIMEDWEQMNKLFQKKQEEETNGMSYIEKLNWKFENDAYINSQTCEYLNKNKKYIHYIEG